MRKVRTLNFDEALGFFQKEDKNKTNKIYMLAEYEIDSCKYELYAPCRYTNYSPLRKTNKFSSRFPDMSYLRTKIDSTYLMWPHTSARTEPSPLNFGLER